MNTRHLKESQLPCQDYIIRNTMNNEASFFSHLHDDKDSKLA